LNSLGLSLSLVLSESDYKLVICGRAQREAARRRKSDWESFFGEES